MCVCLVCHLAKQGPDRLELAAPQVGDEEGGQTRSLQNNSSRLITQCQKDNNISQVCDLKGHHDPARILGTEGLRGQVFVCLCV